MVTPDDVEYLREALMPLCAPLHEGLTVGSDLAQAYLHEHDLGHRAYKPLHAHIARAHARRHLERCAPELEGWRLAPSANNVQVRLARGSMGVRLLRATADEAAPAPGRNRARVRYYANVAATLFGVQDSQLVAGWWRDTEGLVQIRVVRPVGTWTHGSSSLVDIDFMLPATGAQLADLAFEPDDEDLAFEFPTDDEEEGGEGASGVDW